MLKPFKKIETSIYPTNQYSNINESKRSSLYADSYKGFLAGTKFVV